MSASEMIEPEAGFIAAGQAFNEGPEEDEGDGGDNDLDEDADEFEDPDALDDLYEEMTERHREPWIEQEGDPSPSLDEALLDLSGGAAMTQLFANISAFMDSTSNAIGWCPRTHNFWRGCSPVSEGRWVAKQD